MLNQQGSVAYTERACSLPRDRSNQGFFYPAPFCRVRAWLGHRVSVLAPQLSPYPDGHTSGKRFTKFICALRHRNPLGSVLLLFFVRGNGSFLVGISSTGPKSETTLSCVDCSQFRTGVNPVQTRGRSVSPSARLRYRSELAWPLGETQNWFQDQLHRCVPRCLHNWTDPGQPKGAPFRLWNDWDEDSAKLRCKSRV